MIPTLTPPEHRPPEPPAFSVPPPPPPAPFSELPQPTRPRRAPRVLVTLALVAAGAVAGGVTARIVTPDGPRVPSDAVTAPLPPGSSAGAKVDVSALVAHVLPSVVSIEVRNPQGAAAGTGFITSADGDIVTNAHVVADASSVKVTFQDKSVKTAKIVGVDRTDDLAVIKVSGSKLPALPLGSSSALTVGQPVVAIGNALALTGGPTATEGIVSALDRTIQTDNGENLRHLVQTDAAINPGNSGGPLLDLSGAVVGINSAGSSDAQNIGFAISIDGAKPIIDQLEQGKTVARAFLGVSTQPVDGGLQVVDVAGESGAADAGLQVGDVIVSANGVTTTDEGVLRDQIAATGAGKSMHLKVRRDGKDLDLTAVLSSHTA